MKIIFIHIPKSGGTTLKSIFLRDYGESNLYEDQSDFGIPCLAEIREEVICGHISYSPEMDGNILLTVLRDPLSRIISHFEHVIINEHPSIEFALKGLEYYASNPHHPQLDNGMVRQITNTMDLPIGSITNSHLNEAVDVLNSFSAVGVLELYDEFIMELLEKKIIKTPEYEIQNKSIVHFNLLYTNESLQAIIDHNRYDVELYNYFANKMKSKTLSRINNE